MGVDYTAKFGIGYMVTVPTQPESDDKDTEEQIDEFFYSVSEEMESLGLKRFQCGDELAGDELDLYLVFENPFSQGLDLTDRKAKLDGFISKYNITTHHDFNVVGGLRIW